MKLGYFPQLQFIYRTLASGQIALLVLLFVIAQVGTPVFIADKALSTALTIALSIVTLSGVGMSHFLYKVKLAAALQKEELQSKLDEYRLACLLRWSLIEFPCLLALVAFFITSNKLFLVGFSILFVYFLFLRPSLKQTVAVLHLSEKETETLFNSNESHNTD
jgi:hypothetical protein